MKSIRKNAIILLTLLGFSQCQQSTTLPPGDPDNGGLFLPDGFEAVVVIDSLNGRARHLAINNNGDVYVKLRKDDGGRGNAALRDTDNDGKADIVEIFGEYKSYGSYGTAIRIYNDYLYFASELVVYRQKLTPGKLVPEGELEEIVVDDHEHKTHEHIGKPIAFDNQGNLYVPFGAPSNSCQDPKRTPGAPGMDPCPQLERHGGVWKFDANKIGQTQEDGEKYSTGIRSVVGMDWNSVDDNLYLVIHGRDDLLRLFPDRFSPLQSAELPSEEFIRVTEGSDFGWPYCYYDQIRGKKVLAPEYGGDGKIVGRCDQFDNPDIGFPGHWAPNDLVFYQGDQFPERYRNGAFIAFHGSTNRAPYPQSGYFICFAPFENGRATGEWEVFADGFAGVDPIVNVSDAIYRPMGIAVGPDGSLYIGETEEGKIWRIMFKGNKSEFGAQQLAKMEDRKSKSNLRRPHEIDDNLAGIETVAGQTTYGTYCSTCHQQNGKGATGRFPTLVATDWVNGDKNRLIGIILNGLQGPIEVNGVPYEGLMPQHSYLSDADIAEVLTYIRQGFGNNASEVTVEEVSQVRNAPGT